MTESAHAEALARLLSKNGQASAWKQQQSTYFEPFSIARAIDITNRWLNIRASCWAFVISGILNPFQFPPPGIKRDFRGIHSLFTTQKINGNMMPRALRAKARREQTVGLLAPHRRQGSALHPGQPGFLFLGLKSALPVAVGRERPHTHSEPCSGLSLLHGAACGGTLRVRVINSGMVPAS